MWAPALIKVALNIHLTVSYLRNFVRITKQIFKIFTKSEQILGWSNQGHVGRTRGKRNEYNFWSLNVKGKDPVEDLGLDLISENYGVGECRPFIWLWLRVSGGCCEHDNESSGSIKGDNISWLADRLLAFKAGIFSTELI